MKIFNIFRKQKKEVSPFAVIVEAFHKRDLLESAKGLNPGKEEEIERLILTIDLQLLELEELAKREPTLALLLGYAKGLSPRSREIAAKYLSC